MKPHEKICYLGTWGGGWAMRSLFDLAVQYTTNGTRLHVDDALLQSLERSEGLSAHRYALLLRELMGLHVTLPSPRLSRVRSIGGPLKPEQLPPDALPEFWLDKLCDQLRTTRRSVMDCISAVYAEDKHSYIDTDKLLQQWCFPFLAPRLGLSRTDHAGLDVKVTQLAAPCWRRWYQNGSRRARLLVAPNRYGFSDCRWLVCSVIHDGAHLLHMLSNPSACDTSDPYKLAVMETVAMVAEREVLATVEEGFRFEESIGPRFPTHTVQTMLLVGLFERSLRAIYDYEVHYHGEDPERWAQRMYSTYELELPLFGFATEFHGLPGLPSIYSVGPSAWATLSADERVSLLSGIGAEDFVTAALGSS